MLATRARHGVFGMLAAVLSTCAKFNVPVFPRGYWARLQAGKPTTKMALRARSPGMSDVVVVGGRNHYCHPSPSEEEELLGPLPDPPTFLEDIALVRDGVRKVIGKVSVGGDDDPTSMISRLLAQDEARREKQKTSPYTFSWETPVFDSRFEQRRLRLLNALFLAVAPRRWQAGGEWTQGA
jgi:hypothetical protein